MSSKKAQQIRQTILKYNTELSKLKTELEKSESANEKYNKILIRKAICKKQLDDCKISLLQKFLNKFSRPAKEKLICDYFKS